MNDIFDDFISCENLQDFSKPTASNLADHDVPVESGYLFEKRVALLVTSGIAAFRVPSIARGFRRHGATVTVFLSDDASQFVGVDALEWASNEPVVRKLSASAEHLSENHPIDLYVVVPATYNTINKFHCGIADNLITSVLSAALGRLESGKCQIMIIPTMHGSMHNSILSESIKQLVSRGVKVMLPRDAFGKHNIPSTRTIVYHGIRALSTSPLVEKKILVTAGSTPVWLDDIRQLRNRFQGTLGKEIAMDLWLRGANIDFVLGGTKAHVLPFQPIFARDFDQYLEVCKKLAEAKKYHFAIFSAGVADYRFDNVHSGKIKSMKSSLQLTMIPTVKVIDQFLLNQPQVKIVGFKFESNITSEDLQESVSEKLGSNYIAYIANRNEDQTGASHVAYLLTPSGGRKRLESKKDISLEIARQLELNCDCSSAGSDA